MCKCEEVIKGYRTARKHLAKIGFVVSDRTRNVIVGLVLLVLASTLGMWYNYQSVVSKPIHFDNEIFLVESGNTLTSIIDRLYAAGKIRASWPLHLFSRINGLGDHIQIGEYVFEQDLLFEELINFFASGKHQISYRFTIIEGWTFRQMREVVTNAPGLEIITRDWDEERIMGELGAPDLHPEGQFYPDTYIYRVGDTDLSIYRIAFELMQDRLNNAWQIRSSELPISDPYQVLIIASIIEKESQARDEYSIISGVLNNRLKIGMRLQADPTVIYGIGPDFKGKITRKHLKTDTPYNTYTRYGLPPTPISLPGESAMIAAVTPTETDALYFVSMGNGRHKFSKTLKEHNAAVRKYILGKN